MATGEPSTATLAFSTREMIDRMDQATLAERERCAKIAEQAYCGLADVGFEKYQEIRRKHGAAIAAKIREH